MKVLGNSNLGMANKYSFRIAMVTRAQNLTTYVKFDQTHLDFWTHVHGTFISEEDLSIE